MSIKGLLGTALAGILLVTWGGADADTYKVRLYNPATTLWVTGTAEFTVDRNAVLGQGTCITVDRSAANAFNVTELIVTDNGVNVTFSGKLDATICRSQSKEEAKILNGTQVQLQCLDNGVNLAWVTGTLSKTVGVVPYTLTTRGPVGGAWTNGCTASNEPVIAKNYDLAKGGRTGITPIVTNGNYGVPNQIHANPEPGSFMLILAGFGSMGLLAWVRARRRGHVAM
jgi:hypothetical protein